MRVFVTVGATSPFDSLVEAVLSPEVCHTLSQKNYDHLVIQVGQSMQFQDLHEERNGLKIEVWRMKASLDNDIVTADLVISHAGSGSILGALRKGKPLIVVPNTTLLHNHQLELARGLEHEGYLISTTVSDLASTLSSFNPSSLLPFPDFDPNKFTSLLDEEMGFEL